MTMEECMEACPTDVHDDRFEIYGLPECCKECEKILPDEECARVGPAVQLQNIAVTGADLKVFEENFELQVEAERKGQGSFLEQGSGGEGHEVAWTAVFAPEKWRPMLARSGFKVGEGSFGKVFVVDVVCSSQEVGVALKLEKKAGTFQQSEMDLGKLFDHPHIIKVYDSGELYEGGFRSPKAMLMEAAKGDDLQEKFMEMSPKQIALAILQTISALKYMHSMKYTHADVKPEQVLFSTDCSKGSCSAKLADLGFTDKDGTSKLAGSPVYMSPELIVEKRLSLSADMWALGMTIYQVTHRGQFPAYYHTMRTANDCLNKIAELYNEKISLTASGDSHLDKLISGLLTVQVNDRLKVAAALDLAKEWAKQEGVSEMDIQQVSNGRNTAKLPPCWGECIMETCPKVCKENTNSAGVYCDNEISEKPKSYPKRFVSLVRPIIEMKVLTVDKQGLTYKGFNTDLNGVITDVFLDSPASRAGLMKNDRIVASSTDAFTWTYFSSAELTNMGFFNRFQVVVRRHSKYKVEDFQKLPLSAMEHVACAGAELDVYAELTVYPSFRVC